jgi:hypothetical protein
MYRTPRVTDRAGRISATGIERVGFGSLSRCVGCRRRACLTHWTAAHPRSRALKPSRRFPSRVFFLRSQFSLPLCQAAAKSEVEECIHRLQSTNKGVQTIIIVNNDGVSALNHCLPTLLWRVEQLRASSLTYPSALRRCQSDGCRKT